MKNRMNRTKGVLDGLDDAQQEQEQRAEKVASIKRSYMLDWETIRMLRQIHVREVEKTLSDIVKEAIRAHYERMKE